MRARALRWVPRAGIALALVPVVWFGSPVSPASAAVPTATNPPISDSCGLTVTLVLDASGSIESSNAVGSVRQAAATFLDSLRNTGSSARVTQFATVSAELAPSTLVDDAALGQDGALTNALTDYYNPKPPRPGNVNFYRYNGSGSPSSSSSFSLNNSSSNNQYTNWDAGLHQAGAGTLPKLVVFVTDGDPTAYDFEASDPIQPPNVPFNTGAGPAATPTLDRAVVEANAIKDAGTRMLTVGVGQALSNSSSVSRLQAVTGPLVVRDADLANVDSLNEIDVALVTDFDDLAAFLRSVVLQLCSPSLTIRKLAQTASNATYQPAPGWSMQTTPTVPGGSFRWILPDTTSATSKTVVTDANGFAQFQWEPTPADADSRATVQETVLTGYTAGRPDGDDFSCEFRDEFGAIRRVSGELSATGSFTLDPIGQEVGTCTVWNSFNYQPAIAVTKSNAPTEVRGDLVPPTVVTSSYVVTNPGNTPLSNVHLVDNQCGPVVAVPATGFNAGDTDRDGLLDPGESWQFTCARGVSASRRSNLGGTPVVNTVTAFGTPPTGTSISAQATDDVLVFTPGILLTKLVDGQPVVTVTAGTQVTYTYTVANTGNTPLSPVTLVDDTPPCQSPTRGADTPGNGDAVLDLGETWTYSCVAAPTTTVTNTATVSGVPINPVTGLGFPDRNPPVTSVDRAEVDVVSPGISLTKAVTPDVVVVNPAAPVAQPVTYTFAATNTGSTPLNRPGATTAGPATQPGWLVDARCTSAATFTGGDGNANALLDPGETWTFTCPGLVVTPTTNTATITGQPSDAGGTPLLGIGTVTDDAQAFVDVVSPAITIVKTALRPVVVDPAAEIVEGPDLPRRPAEYTYDVTNTGTVALDLTPDPPVDDRCAPLDFVGGDENNDSLLDVDETWNYTCSTLLSRSQGTPPPTGNESASVRNTVTATGIPSFEGTLFPQNQVSATDIASVLVIQPAIAITKSATPPVILADGSVTYTFAVSNPGDVGLEVIGPADDQCAPLTFVSGDTNGDGLIEGANSAAPEVWTYRCTRSIALPEPPATTVDNTASVAGVDPLGNVYTSESTASVRVFRPFINLEKSVSAELVPVGREVTYGFDVTNIGVSPIPADDILADVRLADASVPPATTPPGCVNPTFVGGDTTGDNQLDRVPPEVWRYECAGPITLPTTDLAVVVATAGLGFNPPIPVNVVDASVASARPFHPAITVTKTAEPTQLLGGGPVTYTYEVRNAGDVPLADVEARITDDTCSAVAYLSGDLDDDGLLDTPNSIFEDSADEIWIFTCTTDITVTTTNTVVVTGTPTTSTGDPLCGPQTPNVEPCDVTDDAVATVTVVVPGSITVIKEVTDASTTEFAFDLAGTAFSLTDGASRAFDPLAPGNYVVTETPTQGYALTTIVCEDPGGGTTVDVGAGTATVALAEGEAVTCTFTNAPAPEADLEIEKVVDERVVTPGDSVVYTLIVTNLGPDDAEGVVVTDELPAELTIDSYPDECVLDGTTLTCDIGDLAAGDSVSLEIEATVEDTGLFTNVASVDSNTPDPDPDNNDSSAEVLAADETPQTGTDVDGIIRAGAALVLLGSILVVVTLQRRRRRLV